MAKFREKPVVVDAVQWTGANVQEISEFVAGAELKVALPRDEPATCIARFDYTTTPPTLTIPMLDGEETVSVGEWVIRDADGELQACSASVFEATYEPVPSSALPWIDSHREKPT